MAKTKKEKKIHNPNYELDGVASKPRFFDKKGKEVKAPKDYHPKWKFWLD